MPHNSVSGLLCLGVLGLAWLSQSRHGAHAAVVCPNTGLPSPDFPILVNGSPDVERGQLWLLGPDCDRLVVDSNDPVASVWIIGEKGIERVVSTPIGSVEMIGNPLTRGADFSNVSSLTLKRFAPKILSGVVFPGGAISLVDSPLTLSLLKTAGFRSDTTSLTLQETQLKSLKGFTWPPSLKELVIITSKLAAVDFSVPPLLQVLVIRDSLIAKVERVVMPELLSGLDLSNNKISVMKGVRFPSSLRFLYLEGNPLVEFEVRESDFGAFDLYYRITGDFSQVKCTDVTAKLKPFQSGGVCVISDERFASQYEATTANPSGSVVPSPISGTSSNGSTQSTGSDESSPQDDEPTQTAGSDSSSSDGESKNSTSKSLQPSADGSGSDRGEATSINPSSRETTQSQGGSQSTSKTTVINTTKASSRGITTILAVLSGLIALVLGAWIYRAFMLSKKKRSGDGTNNGKYVRAETPGASASDPTASTAPSQEYLMNDIRNDKAILGFRINQTEIKLNKQIARGGYGLIYRAIYGGKDVGVKQMLPGTWHDNRALANFMDEIRLCASLDHPKIVAFVGFAYSSLRDLSVVIEFMPGGDLHALLLSQQEELRSSREWSHPWTSSQIKCKASIGQDVAEAVAYLHSREPPIIHRDLKARNVLLDLQGNAKLSDFGISRELTIDETMTSGIGTAAWIAPEVLRGARYDEKADVYSLGVLLVELDRCQHPYADEPVLQKYSGPNDGTTSVRRSSMSHAAHKNTQIAVLVSTGKLRPSVSRECPDPVATLVAQCLSFDPQQRPSAHEVASALSSSVKESS